MIFIFESVNLIINLLLFVIICISARNSVILKPFQVLYLAFSIIIWLLITLYHILKMGLLIYTRFKKLHDDFIIVKYASSIHLFRIIAYCCAFLFMFIGFIYDIVMIIDGKIATIVYPIIYFVVCFVYAILSSFNYILKEKALNLIITKMRVIQNSSINSEENKNELRKSDEESMNQNEENAQKESEKPKEE